jgi:hypothetical protein
MAPSSRFPATFLSIASSLHLSFHLINLPSGSVVLGRVAVTSTGELAGNIPRKPAMAFLTAD